MNNIQRIKNILLFTVAVVALFMAVKPFGIMTSSVQVVSACVVLALAALLSVLALRDQPRDEREQEIVNLSDKIGFSAGVLVTGVVILVDSVRDEHNSGFEVVLALMVISKLIANFYYNRTK